MKITTHLILSLVLTVSAVAGGFTYLNVRAEKERLLSEMEQRAALLAESAEASLGPLLEQNQLQKLNKVSEKLSKSDKILAVAIYDLSGNLVSKSQKSAFELPQQLDAEAFDEEQPMIQQSINQKKVAVYRSPIELEDEVALGTLLIFHHTAHIDNYLAKLWQRTFWRILTTSLLIASITLLIIRWSVMRPIKKMSTWMSDVRKGKIHAATPPPKEDLFAPMSKELHGLARSLALARASAEEEARLRQNADSLWTKERLKEYAKGKLNGKKLIVISNREPYMHLRQGKEVSCLKPASGLITALDPPLKACDGIWIAHGAGNADRDTVNEQNMLRVPPENPQYDLKRVWLNREEEQGYYYGFSNEGLWPLCHIAHNRPIFRADDWAHYQEVNLKFADALDEVIDDESFIFIQDYHFAILPRIIKERHPKAKIAPFWHIPWPNPEAFGICPWKREILHGMLGADIMGFHTQFHCNNFLETVDQTLECRTDWERFSTTRLQHSTFVKPFPISVDSSINPLAEKAPSKEDLLQSHGVKASILGLGVDRVDYTKGIPERLRAIERFLEKHPEYIGELSFVQIGAPSREHIKRYHDLLAEVIAEVDRINSKFQNKNWRPIIYLNRHFSHAEILPYYERADFCIVNSLHDGMNLVAKEYVASRHNETGVLILSTFTGAARELRDALLINPYDIEQTADMIREAIQMSPDEQRIRMFHMRSIVRENNIYKWAADVITELSQMRTE